MGTPYKMKGSPMQRNFGVANFNMKGGKTTTPNFSTTKIGKAKAVIEQGLKKGIDVVKKKASRFIPGVGTLISAVDLMTSKTATATKPVDHGASNKGSYSDDIQKIIPKPEKKSIWDNKKKIVN